MGGVCTSAFHSGVAETSPLLGDGEIPVKVPKSKCVGFKSDKVVPDGASTSSPSPENDSDARKLSGAGVHTTTAATNTNTSSAVTSTSESAAVGVRFQEPHQQQKQSKREPNEELRSTRMGGGSVKDGGEEKLGMMRPSDSFHAPTVIKEVRTRRASQHLFQNLVVENIARNIEDYYDVHTWDVLGDGLSGIVVRATNKHSGIEYAVKTLHKKSIKMDEYIQVKEEIRVMQELDHPNILRLHEYFEDQHFIFLVSELCLGGELLKRLHQQSSMHYSERVACRYVFQMVSAIRYLHAHNIVHRDLKLENFLFVSDSDTSELKLIDFGLSRHFNRGEEMHQSVGTPYYIAPEVLEGNYDARCDVWSLGVITYMLLSGKPPFDGSSGKQIMDSIRRQHWNFTPDFHNVSRRAKSFISTCMSSIAHRPTAEEAAHHNWFTTLHEASSSDGGEENDKAVSKETMARLRDFGSRNMLSRVCMEVVAHTMQPEQIQQLKHEFALLDTDNTGTITYADLRKALKQTIVNSSPVHSTVAASAASAASASGSGSSGAGGVTVNTTTTPLGAVEAIAAGVAPPAFTPRGGTSGGPSVTITPRNALPMLNHPGTPMSAGAAAVPLTESDLEDIFKDINFDQTGAINYHEFIAATLSRSSIREENFKMAFMKITSNNADYFTGEDLSRLAGIDGDPQKIAESLRALNIQPNEQIDYDKFKSLVNDPSYKTPKHGDGAKERKRFSFADKDNIVITALNNNFSTKNLAAVIEAAR